MNRKEFLRLSGILGVGLPLQATLSSCTEERLLLMQGEKVLIIGAGAAGLTAAYQLMQKGVDFEVLEGSSTYGGRMKTTQTLADFPIPLGAEWLHVEKDVLAEIVNDSAIQIDVPTVSYDQEADFGMLDGRQLTPSQIGFTIDQKFVQSSWFNFFDQYIVPSIKDKITFNETVKIIDYSGDKVLVESNSGVFSADRLIITVAVKLLQNGAITFRPELPARKANAIEAVTVWDGFKAFIEFSEKFYNTFTPFDTRPSSAGQKLYYDAAYGQNSSSKHIMGLFTVGTEAQNYISMSETERIEFMLEELDALYEGKASKSYVKHIFQNWNDEAFANGAYIYDNERSGRIRKLGESVENKLYFAGDAYTTGADWGSVHAAARSAIRAVTELTTG